MSNGGNVNLVSRVEKNEGVCVCVGGGGGLPYQKRSIEGCFKMKLGKDSRK